MYQASHLRDSGTSSDIHFSLCLFHLINMNENINQHFTLELGYFISFNHSLATDTGIRQGQ